MIEVTPATEIFNLDVLNAVPNSSKKIVEIGTGSGALAKQLINKFPGVEYVGVEIFEEYLKKSAAYCSRMYLENFENASGELLLELRNADVLIFADVLEHFNNPWKVLSRVHKWLPDGALVIACIPNAQHWSMQVSILSGNFFYADSGLLDKTHLRFFTRKTILQLFDPELYILDSMYSRVFDFPGQENALTVLGSTAEKFGLNRQEYINDSLAFQYVIKARVRG